MVCVLVGKDTKRGGIADVVVNVFIIERATFIGFIATPDSVVLFCIDNEK
jgi:hypothetical protein